MIDLTILIPCLNEEETIGICIEKANKFLNKYHIKGEVLVVDNGSSDNSFSIAKKSARVIKENVKGYGSALITGIKNAKGKYIIMADADDSYNFLEIYPFFKKLKEGYDLVIGNRYHNMEKGSMKLLHRYVGTPFLSFLIKIKYKVKLNDINCGLRGFNKTKILNLNLTSQGMEFASEMIIKSSLNNLKIIELPINFYRDKRSKEPHLNTIRDGLRHLKIIMSRK